jgi:hypothetical protein
MAVAVVFLRTAEQVDELLQWQQVAAVHAVSWFAGA